MERLLRAYTQHDPGASSDETTEAIRRHAPMVYRIVRQMSERLPSWVDREELFSVGMVGLLDALAKFDPTRGIELGAYAHLRVKGAILDELRHADHLSRRMRSRSTSVREAREALGPGATDEMVAERAGLTLEEIQATDATQQTAPASLEHSMLEGLSQGGLWQESRSTLDNLEWTERVRQVSQALAGLPERNRMVVGLYYEAQLTLREIGEVLGVTQSRVSQIMKETVEMLRERLAEA